LGANSQSNNAVRQTSTDLVEQTSTEPGTACNGTTCSSSSLPSASSTPLLHHPLCETHSYYSDGTHTVHTTSTQSSGCLNVSVPDQQMQGELEFAVDSLLELSQPGSLEPVELYNTQTENENSKYSTGCSHTSGQPDNNFNKFKPELSLSDDSSPTVSCLPETIPGPNVQVNTSPPEITPGYRRYRLQSCDILETGSWIICENIF
jgi:hypothetical protein